MLLAGQLAGVLLYPFMEGSDVGQALFSLFGIAILGLVVLAVRSTRSADLGRRCWSGFPATVLLLIQAVTGDDALLPYSSGFEAVLYFYAAFALIRQIARATTWSPGTSSSRSARSSRSWRGHSPTRTPSCQAIEPGSFTAAD